MPYGLALLFVFIFYAPVLVPKAQFVLGDYYDLHVPYQVYNAKRLKQLELPHWEIGTDGGWPVLADPQAAFFYPPNLIQNIFLSPQNAGRIMDAMLLAHVCLLALGSVFLARSLGLKTAGSLITSVLVTFNGFIVLHLAHINIIQCIAWGTWSWGCMAHAIRRSSIRWSVLAGFALAVSAITGHPQTSLYACYVAALGGTVLALHQFISDRRQGAGWARLAWLMGLAVLPLVLCVMLNAVQILPTAELLKASGNRRQLTLQESLFAYLHPKSIPGLLFPGFYQPLWWRLTAEQRADIGGNWSFDWSTEYMYWCGLVALTLALLGWLVHFRRALVQVLFWGWVLIIIASLGQLTPLYEWTYYYVPGFKQMRIPVRMMGMSVVALGLLGGLAVDAISSGRYQKAIRRAVLLLSTLLGTAAIAAMSFVAWTYRHKPDWLGTFTQLFVSNSRFPAQSLRKFDAFESDVLHQFAFAGLTLVAVLVLLQLSARISGRRRVVAFTWVGLIFAELFAYGFYKNITTPGHAFAPHGVGLERVDLKATSGRTLDVTLDRRLATNAAFSEQSDTLPAVNVIGIGWVRPFQPTPGYEILGPGSERQKARAWNVSRLLVPDANLKVTVNNQQISLPGVGWIKLPPSATGKPQTLKLALKDARPLRRIHLLTAAENAPNWPDGAPAAEVQFLGEKDDILSSTMLRFGMETADWSYGWSYSTPLIKHSMPRVALINPLYPGIYPEGKFFLASFDAPASATVSAIRVTAKAAPSTICISHLLAEDSRGLERIAAISAVGASVSLQRPYRIIELNDNPGYAWLVPTAEAVSYQENYASLQKEFSNPEFDVQKKVLLDEQQVEKTIVERRNAPTPATYKNRVTFKRPKPEQCDIVTESNQRGWLVVSQTWFRGWSAKLDRQYIPLYQANGGNIAMAVPAGRHVITLTYSTPHLIAGAIIALIGLGAGLILLLRPPGKANPHL